MLEDLVGKSLSFAFRCLLRTCCFSISRVVFLSFPILPIVCFAPVMFTMPFWRLMSAAVSHVSSMGLVPMSLLMDSISAIRGDALDMSMLIFSSCGIFGSLSYLL